MVLPLVLLTNEFSTELNPLFKPAMVLTGLFAGTVLFLSSYALTENEYARTEEPLGFVESMVKALKNREFLAFEAMNFPHEMAFTIVTGSMIYFAQYVLRFQGLLASIPFAAVFGVMLLFSYFADNHLGLLKRIDNIQARIMVSISTNNKSTMSSYPRSTPIT
jgi:Na+/melibiose symporter-like transporter